MATSKRETGGGCGCPRSAQGWHQLGCGETARALALAPVAVAPVVAPVAAPCPQCNDSGVAVRRACGGSFATACPCGQRPALALGGAR